jgi:hypothetical protein
MKPVAVLDRDTKAREQRAGEPAEHLLWRDGLVAVVEKIGELTPHKLVMGKIGHIADVVMRTHEGETIGPCEERSNGFDFGFAGFLAGAEGVEADDDEDVGAV